MLSSFSDRIDHTVSEGTNEYPLPVSGGGGTSFESITWNKENTDSAKQIATYVNGIGLVYKYDYCPVGINTCDSSVRGELDITSATPQG